MKIEIFGDSKSSFEIDEDIYPLVSSFRWRRLKTRSGIYARAWTPMVSNKRSIVYAHRLIAEHLFGPIHVGMVVDHINRDTLDNRAQNLRIVSRSVNSQNKKKSKSSAHKSRGVALRKYGRWEANIRVGGVPLYLGSFGSEVEAAMAYDNAAKSFFGEHASTNMEAS